MRLTASARFSPRARIRWTKSEADLRASSRRRPLARRLRWLGDYGAVAAGCAHQAGLLEFAILLDLLLQRRSTFLPPVGLSAVLTDLSWRTDVRSDYAAECGRPVVREWARHFREGCSGSR
jgi:hypothetical protein